MPPGDAEALGWARGPRLDRRQFLRAGVAAAALALPACRSGQRGQGAGEQERRPTVRLAGFDFGFPGPFTYFAGPGYVLTSYAFDSLLWYDPDHDLIPWLASGYQRSDDGLVHTFQLREGVRWHDGRPLTAEDVVFSYEYFPRITILPPMVVARPYGVQEVRASGRRVEVRLDAPVANFTRWPGGAFLPIVPKHVWGGITEPALFNDDVEMLVGSGPYRVTRYSASKGSYLFEANDDFFLGKPAVRRVEMRPVPNEDELTAVLAGEIDAGRPNFWGARPEALRPFRDDPDFGLLEGPLDFPIALYWNLAKGGPLADVRFRRACAHAIDRQALVDLVLAGNGRPGNPGFLPPTHPFHFDVEQYRFDPELANRLLDEAGYRRASPGGPRRDLDGKPLRIPFLVIQPLLPTAEVVMGSLAKLGIELQPQSVDRSQMAPVMLNGSWHMALIFYGNASGDPTYMRILFSNRRETRAFHQALGYSDAEFEDLADRQTLYIDDQERREIVARMQRIVARDIPMLHLYYPNNYFVYRRAAFDQWTYYDLGGFLSVPENKLTLATGRKDGGMVAEAGGDGGTERSPSSGGPGGNP